MNSATAQELCRLVPRCPTCDSTLAGHQFAEVATAVCGRENISELTTFFECVKKREWARLRGFREFKGDRDAVVANVVACNKGGAVIVLKSVFELYAPDELLLLEPITQDDLRVIEVLIDEDAWLTINT